MLCPPCWTRRATRSSASSGDGSQRNTRVVRYPSPRPSRIRSSCMRPAHVVSSAKLSPARMRTPDTLDHQTPGRDGDTFGIERGEAPGNLVGIHELADSEDTGEDDGRSGCLAGAIRSTQDDELFQVPLPPPEGVVP